MRPRRSSVLSLTAAGLALLAAACSDSTAPTSSLRAGSAALTIGPTPNAPGSVGTNFSSSAGTQFCGGTPGLFTIPATTTFGAALTCGASFDLQGALAVYNPGWDQNLAGSSWIGPNANANEYKTFPGRFVFQTSFTLAAGVTSVVLNDTLLSDNAVAVYLNGTLLEQQVIADCATGVNCNWNTTNKFVISAASATLPGGGFVVGTNYITVFLVDTPNGGNAGNSYACTKLPQPNGSLGFTQSNNVPTAPLHVYAGFTAATTLAQYAAAGCQNPTGLDFSGRVSWVVPVVTTWCSPGFWKNQGFDLWTQYHNTLYSSLNPAGAPLSKKAPTSGPGSNPTLAEVIANPSVYGGPATNSVADFLSFKAFGTPIGTGVESCPNADDITVH
jgi:hypothetical protein